MTGPATTATTLLLLLAAAQDDASHDPARLVPEGTDVVLHVPDMPALRRKLENEPYKGLAASAGAMRSLVGDAVEPTTLLLPARGQALFAHPRFDGEELIAIFDTGAPFNIYQEIVPRLLGKDWERETVRIEGSRVVRATGPASTLYFASVRRWFIVARGGGSLGEVIRRARGNESEGSLGDSEGYRSAVADAAGADMALMLNWRAASERIPGIGPLRIERATAAFRLDPEALRAELRVYETSPGAVSDFFGPEAEFRLPPVAAGDSDAVLLVRPNWARIASALESARRPARGSGLWEGLGRRFDGDLSAAFLDRFGETLAVIERFDGSGAMRPLAWIEARDAPRIRAATESLFESLAPSGRFFLEGPGLERRGSSVVHTFGGGAASALDSGLVFGAAEEVRRASDGRAAALGVSLRPLEDSIPDRFVVLQLMNGRALRARLDAASTIESVMPRVEGLDRSMPAVLRLWSRRLMGWAGPAARIRAAVIHLRKGRPGLVGEARFLWKAAEGPE